MASVMLPAGAKAFEMEMQVLNVDGTPKGAPIRSYWNANPLLQAKWHLKEFFIGVKQWLRS